MTPLEKFLIGIVAAVVAAILAFVIKKYLDNLGSGHCSSHDDCVTQIQSSVTRVAELDKTTAVADAVHAEQLSTIYISLNQGTVVMEKLSSDMSGMKSEIVGVKASIETLAALISGGIVA